jgi:CheY-like chemotaxis protein
MDPAPRHRVLLLDDDLIALEAARTALSALFDVEATHSPILALQRLREVDFAVVCSAQRLPGLTGLELYQRVRSGSRPAAFVLLAGAEPVPPELTAGGDMVSVLEKPVEPSRLVRLVEQLARLVQMRRNIAAAARPSSRANPMFTPPGGVRPPTRDTNALPEARPAAKTDPDKPKS